MYYLQKYHKQYKDDDELPEATPIQMATETFSEVTVTPSDTKNNKDDDKE